MILGQDLASEAGYVRTLTRDGPESNPTWSRLLRLLADAELSHTTCFFTNFYMGLRQGARATGCFPGARDPQFVRRCSDFFLTQQLHEQRPRLIVTLGRWIPRRLAEVSDALSAWRSAATFEELDASLPGYTGALRPDVRFSGVTGTLGAAVVVALVHPSYRHLTARRRRFEDAQGHEAEVRMLCRARTLAGLDSH
jgi:uracil-DNA glycosylase